MSATRPAASSQPAQVPHFANRSRRTSTRYGPPGAGLSDEEIVDVVLAPAARCFFSKTLDALGVEPDAKYADLDPDVRDALTVGRAIVQH